MLGMKRSPRDRKPEHAKSNAQAAMVGLARALAHSAVRVWLRGQGDETRRISDARNKARLERRKGHPHHE